MQELPQETWQKLFGKLEKLKSTAALERERLLRERLLERAGSFMQKVSLKDEKALAEGREANNVALLSSKILENRMMLEIIRERLAQVKKGVVERQRRNAYAMLDNLENLDDLRREQRIRGQKKQAAMQALAHWQHQIFDLRGGIPSNRMIAGAVRALSAKEQHELMIDLIGLKIDHLKEAKIRKRSAE